MSNYLGIVTRVDLATFSPGDDVWGGQVVTPIDTTGEQITALVSFNDPETYDEHVALIMPFVFVWDLGMSVVVNKEYTKPVANRPVFDVLALLPAHIQHPTNHKHHSSSNGDRYGAIKVESGIFPHSFHWT
jgi:hypothetical protein